MNIVTSGLLRTEEDFENFDLWWSEYDRQVFGKIAILCGITKEKMLMNGFMQYLFLYDLSSLENDLCERYAMFHVITPQFSPTVSRNIQRSVGCRPKHR